MPVNLERLILRILIVIGVVLLALHIWDRFSHRNVQPKPVSARGNLAQEEQSTIAIFSAISPSVVSITTSKRVTDYWRRNVYSVPAGSGSGFIWDDKGHIVTNFHVIKNASSVLIKLNDSREYQASLVGVNPENDLAVLKINVNFESPPGISIGASNQLQVGQSVFALGNPFGLDYTLTKGIISALDRSISSNKDDYIEHLIQTDAAINPGNSGGPLIDSAGLVIGITTAIYSPSGANAGIGFAIPVDTVNRVVTSLIRDGHYQPPDLGIRTDERLNQIASEKIGISGLVVLDVETGSIADRMGVIAGRYSARSGFQMGDLVVALNGKPVNNRRQLLQVLESAGDTETWQLNVWRDGQIITLTLRKRVNGT